MISQIGKGSLLNINWELVSHCQFKCTYCYYGPHKSEVDYSSLSKIVLKKLSTIKEPIKMTLVGGEPTLHPDFHEVIDGLFKIDQIKEINIVTNFESTLEFWKKLIPYASKLKIVVSFHPEYPQKEAFSKIKELSSCLNFDCVFVTHHNLKFYPKLQEYKKNILEILPTNVPFTFVRAHYKKENDHHYFEYPKEIENLLEEMYSLSLARGHFEKVDVLKGSSWSTISKHEFILQGLNKLQGWKCELQAFIIHKDGQVSRSCTNSKKHILLEDFKKQTLTCSYNLCECDDYWTFPKTLA